MALTDDEIDRARTPSELVRFVDEVVSCVREDAAEVARGLAREGVYKRFVDEIVPLSVFAKEEYSDDYRIQPVCGNQGYDALVLDGDGREVGRIEVTVPQDGRAAAEEARQIAVEGFGDVHVYGPGEEIDLLEPWVMATAVKKSVRDYSDSTLVIVLDLLPLLDGMGSQREERLQQLVRQLAEVRFRANRVRLLVLPNRVIPLEG